MYVLILVTMLICKVNSEHKESSGIVNKEKLLFSTTLKEKSTNKNIKIDTTENNIQTNEILLPLLDSEDFEFPVENNFEILLDNRDAQISGESKEIKRFICCVSSESKPSYDKITHDKNKVCSQVDALSKHVKQNSKNMTNLNTTRKKRNYTRRAKRKKVKKKKKEIFQRDGKMNNYDILNMTNQANEGLKLSIHKRDFKEQIPGFAFSSDGESEIRLNDMNISGNKSNSDSIYNSFNQGDINSLFDDNIQSKNLDLFSGSKNFTESSSIQAGTPIRKRFTDDKDIKGIEANENITKNFISSSTGSSGQSEIQTVKREFIIAEDKSLSDPHKESADEIVNLFPDSVTDPSMNEEATEKLIKKGTTEDICINLFKVIAQPNNTLKQPAEEPGVDGGPPSPAPSRTIDQLIHKLTNGSHIFHKTNDNSSVLYLNKDQYKSSSSTSLPILIKVLGLTSKKPHKSIASATLSHNEYITLKVHPGRHKGGDPGNHYHHGKHQPAVCSDLELIHKHSSSTLSLETSATPHVFTTNKYKNALKSVEGKTDSVKSKNNENTNLGKSNENTHTLNTNEIKQDFNKNDISVTTKGMHKENVGGCKTNDIKEILPQFEDEQYSTSFSLYGKKKRMLHNKC